MSFWTMQNNEPVRKYRFQIQTPNAATMSGIWWWAKACDKPSYEVSTSEYQLINHKFKYPGVLTWNDISITIVDYVEGTTAKLTKGTKAVDLMENLGITYSPPKAQANKDQFAKSPIDGFGYNIRQMVIEQLNAKGAVIEKWTLHDAFVKSVDFVTLAYADDEIQEITIELSYDYATLGENKSQGEDTQRDVISEVGNIPIPSQVTPDGGAAGSAATKQEYLDAGYTPSEILAAMAARDMS